jgi:phosphoribosylaminoimidazolecarboxamide formyltransferase/IMP cyclohydrolase
VPSADEDERPIRRSLLSVSDPAELPALAEALRRHRVELIATEGTRRALTAAGIASRPAEEITGIGTWFDGRIKTLHPGLLGGILALRTERGEAELAERQILPIDLVVVNFYPFEARALRAPGAADLVEAIDIGGVTLARAAAKNHAGVTVVVEPTQYRELARELDEREGRVSLALRRRFAVRAFVVTQAYDAAIAAALATAEASPAPTTGGDFPSSLAFARETFPMRYGENPHQRAAPYTATGPEGGPLAPWPLELLKGERLSYTNLLDLDTALAIVAEFPTPTAAVVKHATPCGVSSGTTVEEALAGALETDPVARYGCVIAVNRPVVAAKELAPLHGVFVDSFAAPEVGAAARAALERRPKLKLVGAPPPPLDRPRWEAHLAMGRLLVQEADRRELAPSEFRRVSRAAVSPAELCALDFAWRVVRHAKSNAVVLARGSRTVGIGAGQPTRVKAVELAVGVAGERARGAVLASDAFFPFADGVEAAARAGVAAILQPGGSVRDAEVIAAADRAGLAMYFTGWRVFRH